jgi:hypothetical protein
MSRHEWQRAYCEERLKREQAEAEVARLQSTPRGTARIWAVKYEEAAAELTALREQREADTLAFQHALAEKDERLSLHALNALQCEDELRAQRDTYDVLLAHANELERDLAALRQQAADMERGVADALNGAIGEQDMGVVAGVELLAERYAALRQRHDRLLEALRTIIAERVRNLEATCPGEHDYEPDCTHGVNHCPIIAIAKAALERREP